MVSTSDRSTPRRGLSRLGRIEGQTRLPFVEAPPPTKKLRTGRLTRWGLAGAVLAGAAGVVWFLNSRVSAAALVEGETLTLAAPAAVLVEEMLVSPGQWCEKGQPLVRLLPRDPEPARGVLEAQLNVAQLRLQLVERGGETQDLLLTRRFDDRDRLAAETQSALADLAGAQARFDFARDELTRQSQLHDRGHYAVREVNEAERDAEVTQSEMDRAQSELEGARLRWERQQTLVPSDSSGADLRDIEMALLKESVREAEERLCEFDYRVGARTLTAALSGRVDRVFVRAGSARQQGEPLVSIFDPTSLYVLAYVPPDDAEDFPLGAEVRLFVEGDSRPLSGVVGTVYSAWSPVPPVLQRAYGDRQAAVTVRITCDERARQRLAPSMLLRAVATNR